MSKPVFRAPQQEHEIDPSQLRRDTRPILQIVTELMFSPSGFIVLAASLAGIGFVFPATMFLMIVLSLIGAGISALFKWAYRTKRDRLPLRLPLDSDGMLDYSNPYPGRKKYRKGEGSIFLGTALSGEWSFGREIWASFTDFLTHALVLGGTGAGKTETLVSMSFNDVAVGGGLGYIDAKAAPKLYGQQWVISRMCGRDDDMRVLNFALGQDKLGKTPFVRSNTIQPFAIGKAESLKEIPLSLMAGGGGGGGSNGIFESNAKALMTALMMALVEMRDMGEIYLYPGDIVHYMAPMEFVKLASRKDFSRTTHDAIVNFLKSMGWKPEIADSSKWGDFDRQYGYAQNYFLDTFSTMNNTYRHIFAAPIGDINMVDVILQRRIFVCLIPSLEKSKKELENIGRITLSVTRLATAVGLGGGEIMGSWRRLISLGIANARVPFFLKIDEIAAIMIEGFAEIFTQGRGLGISCTVGSQDWSGIQGSTEMTKKEANQMASNTKLKFFMTGDDPSATKKLIEDLAGETEEFRTQGFAVSGMMNYYDTLSAQSQRVSRVNARDIAQQIEGEWHLFFKGEIIRGQGFHAGAGPLSEEYPLFVHHFLQVHRPSKSDLSARFGSLKVLLDEWEEKALTSVDNPDAPCTQNNEAPAALLEVFDNPGRLADKRRELACAAVFNWFNARPGVPTLRSNDDHEPPAQPDDVLNVVAPDEPEPQSQQPVVSDPVAPAAPPVASTPDIALPDEAGDIFASIDDMMSAAEPEPATPEQPEPDLTEEEAEIDQAISRSLTEPAYPLPPKPEATDINSYQNDMMAWLETINKPN